MLFGEFVVGGETVVVSSDCGGVSLLSLVGWVGGGGSAVATGQEKVTAGVSGNEIKLLPIVVRYTVNLIGGDCQFDTNFVILLANE